MADRTTKVTLLAEVSGYVAGMERAARQTREVGTAAERLAAQRQGMDVMGRSMLAFGAVAAAGVAIAITRFADFDKAMSSVKAATQESAGNMSLLREAALEAGGATVFTATEAANAIEELGKAGLTTKDILSGGLNGALDLAAAGALGVAEAAGIAAIAMKQFNLEGTDLPHVADLLAAGAGKAVGSVGDLAAALGQAGLVSNAAGQSIEDTTGVLAAFADAGLLGSDAGTSLKSAIIALQAPTDTARDVMEKYGLSFTDTNGAMLSYSEIAGQLESKMGTLTDAQRNSAFATIFGRDAIRSANVLYDEGAAGIQKYIDQTNDSGYASKVAADRLNNLAGDVEKLGGAFDTALIQTGSAANDALRTMTQSLTFLIDGVASLPGPVLGVGLVIGGVGASMALVGGAALLAIPRIVEFKAALTLLGVTGKTAAIGIGVAGGAIAAAALAVGFFISQAAEQAALTDELAGSLDKATGAMTDYTREIVARRLAESGAFDVVEKLGYSQRELTDAVLEGGDALDEIQAKVAGENNLVNFFNGSGIAAGNASDALRDLEGGIDGSKEKFQDLEAAGAGATEQMDDSAAGLDALGGAAEGAGDKVSDLADAILGFGSTTLDAREASRQFEAAIDDLSESVKNNGTTLDRGTDAGRANEAALDDIAKSALALSAATLTRTGSEEKARAAVSRGRDELIRQLGQFGITGDAAQRYADRLGLVPDNISTAVALTGVGAAEQALTYLTRPRQTYIQAITTGSGVGSPRVNADGGMYSYADGGIQNFASGGYGIYSGGTPLYRFAEPETGWETFISGKRGMERQNLGYAYESINRLQAQLGGTGGMGGSGVSVQITNHNPVAEPTSESVRKAGQYIGALVSGGF